MSIFEAAMLLCFGISWPISIYKSIKTKVVVGKSPLFMSILIIGYANGIMYKLLNNLDWIIVLYIINMIMVSIDMYFYFKYVPKNSLK